MHQMIFGFAMFEKERLFEWFSTTVQTLTASKRVVNRDKVYTVVVDLKLQDWEVGLHKVAI